MLLKERAQNFGGGSAVVSVSVIKNKSAPLNFLLISLPSSCKIFGFANIVQRVLLVFLS